MNIISKITTYNSNINYSKAVIVIWILLVLIWIIALFSVSIYESFTVTLRIWELGSWSLINNISILLSISVLSWLNYIAKKVTLSYKINIYNIFINIILFIVLFFLSKKLISSTIIFPTNYFYFWKQIINISYWLVISVIVYFIPIRFFEKQKNIYIIFFWVLFLQLLVFSPFGAEYNGAMWRVDIPWLPSIQPVEFFKLWYIFFISLRLIRKQKNLNKSTFLVSFIVLHIFIFFVFLMIRDMWSVLVMWLSGLILSWYIWTKTKYIVWGILIGIFFVLFFLSTVWFFTNKFNYIKDRMMGHFFYSCDDDIKSRTILYQNCQAVTAIWWWGFWGQWYGKWQQKMWFIPEAQSDFIFSAFAEELGFVFWISLILLYIFLTYFAVIWMMPISDKYIKLVWVWILCIINIQAFVNLSVNLQILPNTWITLPFVSYGWTAMMVNMIEIILLQKIIKKTTV